MHVCDFGGQKRTWILELKLQMAVSHDVGAGTQTRILWKSSQCSQPPSHLSSLCKLLYSPSLLPATLSFFFFKMGSYYAPLANLHTTDKAGLDSRTRGMCNHGAQKL